MSLAPDTVRTGSRSPRDKCFPWPDLSGKSWRPQRVVANVELCTSIWWQNKKSSSSALIKIDQRTHLTHWSRAHNTWAHSEIQVNSLGCCENHLQVLCSYLSAEWIIFHHVQVWKLIPIETYLIMQQKRASSLFEQHVSTKVEISTNPSTFLRSKASNLVIERCFCAVGSSRHVYRPWRGTYTHVALASTLLRILQRHTLRWNWRCAQNVLL